MSIYFNGSTQHGAKFSIEQSTGSWTTSSSSYTTFQSVSITPSSSSSKILITCSFCYTAGSSNLFGYMRFKRGGSTIAIGDTDGPRQRCTADLTIQDNPRELIQYPVTYKWVDSPSTTSSTTYYIQIKLTNGGTYYFGKTSNGGDGNRSSTVQSFTAQEIGV